MESSDAVGLTPAHTLFSSIVAETNFTRVSHDKSGFASLLSWEVTRVLNIGPIFIRSHMILRRSAVLLITNLLGYIKMAANSKEKIADDSSS